MALCFLSFILGNNTEPFLFFRALVVSRSETTMGDGTTQWDRLRSQQRKQNQIKISFVKIGSVISRASTRLAHFVTFCLPYLRKHFFRVFFCRGWKPAEVNCEQLSASPQHKMVVKPYFTCNSKENSILCPDQLGQNKQLGEKWQEMKLDNWLLYRITET